MPTANFKITTVGNAAAVSAAGSGLDLHLTHVAIGAGSYTPTGSETALVDRREVATISLATKVGSQLTITATFSSAAYTGAAYNIGEIGLFVGNPASGGTLYCVSAMVVGSTSGYGARGGAIGDYEYTFVLTLSGAGSVVANIDPTAAVSAAMMTAHLAAADPHQQYLLRAPLVGAVTMYAGATAPTGWLVCDGSAVSRSAYANLFAALGTLWGAGDGLTTFNIPDMRGMFVRGLDSGRGVDAQSGRTVGSSQSWATGRPKTTTAKSLDSSGATTTSMPPGGLTDSSAVLGFARVTKAGEARTIDSAVDAVDAGVQPDLMVVCDGDPETRPVNVAMLYIIKT